MQDLLITCVDFHIDEEAIKVLCPNKHVLLPNKGANKPKYECIVLLKKTL